MSVVICDIKDCGLCLAVLVGVYCLRKWSLMSHLGFPAVIFFRTNKVAMTHGMTRPHFIWMATWCNARHWHKLTSSLVGGRQSADPRPVEAVQACWHHHHLTPHTDDLVTNTFTSHSPSNLSKLQRSDVVLFLRSWPPSSSSLSHLSRGHILQRYTMLCCKTLHVTHCPHQSGGKVTLHQGVENDPSERCETLTTPHHASLSPAWNVSKFLSKHGAEGRREYHKVNVNLRVWDNRYLFIYLFRIIWGWRDCLLFVIWFFNDIIK